MNNNPPKRQLHIVFLHLDLGIGGAEQLIINLALASFLNHSEQQGEKATTATTATTTATSSNDSHDDFQRIKTSTSTSSSILNAKVSIFTTHCDQTHCFDAVQKNSNPPGILASSVHVVGSFLPVTLFGKGTAFCSTIRMFYLSMVARRMYPNADVIVLDGLPSPIPFLVSQKTTMMMRRRRSPCPCVIYYCHFPDKLLTRDTVNGERFRLPSHGEALSSSLQMRQMIVFLKNLYRKILDSMEEWAISYADLVCVNSEFTRKQVLSVFPSLDSKLCQEQKDKMRVLYPAIDLNKFVPPDFDKKQQILDDSERQYEQLPIVSLNRFERKKNIEILLHAYARLKKKNDLEQRQHRENHTNQCPPLVIAGGYDVRNTENVEYLKELKHLAINLGIQNETIFKPSVSDKERAILLKSALCVVYTPHREHFGIVPLEAMYAGSAVVAMKSGGPEETVIDGVTGILVDMTPKDTCEKLTNAIRSLLDNPRKAIEMGKCGHEHVKNKFGMDPFRQEWSRLVLHEAIPRGRERLKTCQDSTSSRTISSTIIWWCLCFFVAFCAWSIHFIMAK
mmetsp:Transcript_8989/g.16953  ORF Transcript_8989/g.16953 Transcript_8989/m.16953 type:complete len:564 (-) Transcript_8989:26-1717(-)